MSTKRRKIQLQIPTEAEAGDTLTFEVNGNELEIIVPDGGRPGDVLEVEVEVGDGRDAVNDDNDGSSGDDQVADSASATQHPSSSSSSSSASLSGNTQIVPLHACVGVTLEFEGSLDSAGTNNDLSDDSADGTNAMVWAAGVHLARFVSSPQSLPLIEKAKVVLELGSGLGVVGLALAVTILSKKKDGHSKKKDGSNGLQVVLTDLPSALPLLQKNVKRNMEKLSLEAEDEKIVRVAPLEWGKPPSSNHTVAEKVDLLLASDLLYNTSSSTYSSLINTIDAFLSRGTTEASGTFLLSCRWRKPQEERAFFQGMEDMGYTFELLQGCNLSWKEFGDPSCEESNAYFTNTLVEIKGVSKALKDVTEEDMRRMSEDEYEAFECRYIQLFVARKEQRFRA